MINDCKCDSIKKLVDFEHRLVNKQLTKVGKTPKNFSTDVESEGKEIRNIREYNS